MTSTTAAIVGTLAADTGPRRLTATATGPTQVFAGKTAPRRRVVRSWPPGGTTLISIRLRCHRAAGSAGSPGGGGSPHRSLTT